MARFWYATTDKHDGLVALRKAVQLLVYRCVVLHLLPEVAFEFLQYEIPLVFGFHIERIAQDTGPHTVYINGIFDFELILDVH